METPGRQWGVPGVVRDGRVGPVQYGTPGMARDQSQSPVRYSIPKISLTGPLQAAGLTLRLDSLRFWRSVLEVSP